MALSAKILRFEIDISDVDAAVYESLSLRVAQHPSESDEFMLCRVIANALHVGDGIEMSKSGLGSADEPALAAHDLTGRLLLWLDIGSPAAERLHKASKVAERVVVYTHKRSELLLDKLRGQRIFRSAELELYALDRYMLKELAGSIGRTNKWSLLRSDGTLYISVGDCSVSCEVVALEL
jgi:uncharacterized protein YaeQ